MSSTFYIRVFPSGDAFLRSGRCWREVPSGEPLENPIPAGSILLRSNPIFQPIFYVFLDFCTSQGLQCSGTWSGAVWSSMRFKPWGHQELCESFQPRCAAFSALKPGEWSPSGTQISWFHNDRQTPASGNNWQKGLSEHLVRTDEIWCYRTTRIVIVATQLPSAIFVAYEVIKTDGSIYSHLVSGWILSAVVDLRGSCSGERLPEGWAGLADFLDRVLWAGGLSQV